MFGNVNVYNHAPISTCDNNNNNNTLIYIAPACRMTSEATVSNWHQSTSQPVVHQTVTCVWTANKQSFNSKTDEMKQTINQ